MSEQNFIHLKQDIEQNLESFNLNFTFYTINKDEDHFLKKIISISLLFILLIGNSGLAVATHYCGGLAVKSQSVLGHAELNCGMSDRDKDCETSSSKEEHTKKKPCCEDEFQSLELEDEFKPQVIGSSLHSEFVAAFVITFISSPNASKADKAQYINYSPPLIERDIPVLVQSFLI
ncbi:MAG: hypothetical protein RIG62_27255 [Cyclobacteriaceae bacterium]